MSIPETISSAQQTAWQVIDYLKDATGPRYIKPFYDYNFWIRHE